MKTKIISVAVILAIIIVIAIISAHNSGQTVKIGALYPRTGGLASYGEPAYNMAKIAVEDVNASGGIHGQKLELIAEDHVCDPKIALSAYAKLRDTQGVAIFTAVACSGTISAIAPNLEKDSTVLLGTVTSANKLSGISPSFFRNWASDAQESRLIADRIVANKYKTVAALYEETDYAKGLVVSLEGFLASSSVTVSKESFVSGAGDVRTQLKKLQSMNADAVFISVQTVTSGEVVLKQMEQLGFHPKVLFVNDNIIKATSLVTAHSELLEGAIGGDYVFEVSDEARGVLAHYKNVYGVDCPQVNICLAEYDAIRMLAEAIKEKGVVAQDVRGYLADSSYQGLTGTISFDGKNDREGAGYSLFGIDKGAVNKL